MVAGSNFSFVNFTANLVVHYLYLLSVYTTVHLVTVFSGAA
jgi:hypothetical protein